MLGIGDDVDVVEVAGGRADTEPASADEYRPIGTTEVIS